MSYIPASYPWQESYFDAIFETDPTQIYCRVYDAVASIEQRRLSPIQDKEEERALLRAESGMKELIAERNTRDDGFHQYRATDGISAISQRNDEKL